MSHLFKCPGAVPTIGTGHMTHENPGGGRGALCKKEVFSVLRFPWDATCFSGDPMNSSDYVSTCPDLPRGTDATHQPISERLDLLRYRSQRLIVVVSTWKQNHFHAFVAWLQRPL